MSIHPIVQEFIDQPEVIFSREIVEQSDNHVPTRESFEAVNRHLASLTPEQHAKCQKAAHQYLFGKSSN